jgi:hypothetical protein
MDELEMTIFLFYVPIMIPLEKNRSFLSPLPPKVIADQDFPTDLEVYSSGCWMLDAGPCVLPAHFNAE